MKDESGYKNSFPAVKGTQAGRDFYIAMCPMLLIPKLFVFDEEEIPPELRAQRTLNKARIPEIARYLMENKDNYVVSALTASVDSSVKFVPHEKTGPMKSLGILEIPMDAQLLINDGQHRRAAIEAAISESTELKSDNVPVIFFIDKGLKRSQQIFADLNKHAIRPSDSLSTLYDQRDQSSELARFVALSVEGFKGMTEMEKSSISNRSSKLFTLSSIKHASRALLRKSRNDAISKNEMDLAVEFWDAVVANVPDWTEVKRKNVLASELRQTCVHSHGVVLSAIGHMGAELLSRHPDNWRGILTQLKTIDWSRLNSDMWEGRATILGRISAARNNVLLTSNALKLHIGLKLNSEEELLEKQLGVNA